MDTVQQDAFAAFGLAEEGGGSLANLARVQLEARHRRDDGRAGRRRVRGTHFPNDLVERRGRVDRAAVRAVAETYALGVSVPRAACTWHRRRRRRGLQDTAAPRTAGARPTDATPSSSSVCPPRTTSSRSGSPTDEPRQPATCRGCRAAFVS